MKRYATALALVVLFAFALPSLWRVSATSSAHAGPSSNPKVLDVSAFMRNVDRYRDVVQVRGVVSGVSSDRHLFTLIDLAEYQECQSTECAALSLPVRWMGAMPRVRATVRVRGRVQALDGKLIFAADSLSAERSTKP